MRPYTRPSDISDWEGTAISGRSHETGLGFFPLKKGQIVARIG